MRTSSIGKIESKSSSSESTAERLLAPIAVTMGDPSGIGLEISLKAWLSRVDDELPCFLLFADVQELSDRAILLGLNVPVSEISSAAQAPKLFSQSLPVVHVPLKRPSVVGQPASINGESIVASIEQSVAAIASGDACAVLTNPIAKDVLYKSGFSHPGHTEFLAALSPKHFGCGPVEPVMMLASADLRVVPLTIHIALKDVPRCLSQERIVQAVKIVDHALRVDFGLPEPRLAVTGLNPHAGEAGALGDEERDVIGPAVESLKALGLDVSGPHAADTLFHRDARGAYDAAITMYHDQALIPFKTIAFDHGVNITLGLPFVRTSPDHGTAFDIAPLGRASPRSFIESLKLAARVAHNRSKAAV